MIYRNLLQKAVPAVRCIHSSAVRHHDTRGIVGSNLPFNTDNRIRLLITCILFFGSGFALPFISTRRMILAKNT